MSTMKEKYLAHCAALLMPMLVKTMAVMTLVVSAAGTFPVRATPLFCTDASRFPLYVLTGCDTASNRPPVAVGAQRVNAFASRVVDDLLLRPPRHPLVQVGRHGLLDAPPGENGTGPVVPAANGIEGTSEETHTNFPDPMASAVTAEDRWYYMNMDQDGTHIFFGDPDSLDEPMPLEASDDFLPKGIGIGKKWQF